MMLLAVTFCVLFALFSHVLLHCRINQQFLCNRVAGKLPGKLVAPARCVVQIIRVIYNLLVVSLKFMMVIGDSL